MSRGMSHRKEMDALWSYDVSVYKADLWARLRKGVASCETGTHYNKKQKR